MRGICARSTSSELEKEERCGLKKEEKCELEKEEKCKERGEVGCLCTMYNQKLKVVTINMKIRERGVVGSHRMYSEWI